MIYQLSLLATIYLLLSIANCFALDGAWDLLPSPNQYKYITNPITLQFKRQANSDGIMGNQLFVYDCFLSRYLYEVKEDEISFFFKTSSLLSQNCSLSMISQTKLLLQSVYYFQLNGDRLLLQDLVGNAVFSLDRQKIDYKNVIVGVWQLYNAVTAQSANTLAQVNGSMIAMCGGAAGLYYKLNLINDSYPSVSVRGSISPACVDKTFSSLMYSSSFFTVAGNRSQLSFYDPNSKLVLKMNRVSNLNYSSSLYINLRQSVLTKTSFNSAVTTTTFQTTTVQTVNTNNNNIVQPTTAVQITSANNNGQSVRNNQGVQNNISSSSAQSMGMSTLQFQSNSEAIGGLFDIQGFNSDSFSFTSTNNGNPSSSIKQSNLNIQPNIAISESASNQNTVSSQSSSYQSGASAVQSNKIILNNPGNKSSQSVQPSKQLDTSFFSYGQNNHIFGAFTTPQTTNTPASQPSNINHMPANNPTVSNINKIQSNNNKDTQKNTAGIISIQNTINTNTHNNLQTQGNSQQQTKIINHQQTTTNTTQSSQKQSASNDTSIQNKSNDSQRQTLMNGMLNNQLNVAVPISEFVQTGKWQVSWISGLSYIPPTLRMVYLIFTSTKIILYCPCNTYYTNYVLRSNVLGEINWKGTQNQCQNSQDNLVIDVIFYSKMVKANGNNLGFYFNPQIKMAEFKPFF